MYGGYYVYPHSSLPNLNLDSGAVINWNAGDVTLTHSANTLTLAGATALNADGSLVISGGTAANDDITIQGTTNATRTTSYVLLQPSGGNVGIGTATPATALDVNGSITHTGIGYVFYAQTITLNGATGVTVTHNHGSASYMAIVTPTALADLGNVGDIVVVNSANSCVVYNSGGASIPARISLMISTN